MSELDEKALLAACNAFYRDDALKWADEVEANMRAAIRAYLAASPAPRDDVLEEAARNAAVAAVDAIHGYTMEFSSSPAQHRAEYDLAESAIRYELARLLKGGKS